jgi:hypothetical protein
MSEPDPNLLQKAVDDRERRPWRYYRLDYDVMKKFCEQLADEVDRLKAALSASGAGVGWHSMSTAPTDREVWFWVVPKTAEETYVNTSGEPILSQATPHLFRGRRGTWGSLLKATHWQDIHDPVPPPPCSETT